MYLFVRRYSYDPEHQRRKKGKSQDLPETISWQVKFVFKPFLVLSFSVLYKVPLFGVLSWKLKEAICVIGEKKTKNESCVVNYLDARSSPSLSYCAILDKLLCPAGPQFLHL